MVSYSYDQFLVCPVWWIDNPYSPSIWWISRLKSSSSIFCRTVIVTILLVTLLEALYFTSLLSAFVCPNSGITSWTLLSWGPFSWGVFGSWWSPVDNFIITTEKFRCELFAKLRSTCTTILHFLPTHNTTAKANSFALLQCGRGSFLLYGFASSNSDKV